MYFSGIGRMLALSFSNVVPAPRHPYVNADFRRDRPEPATSGPTSANLGPDSANNNRNLPGLGPNSDQLRPPNVGRAPGQAGARLDRGMGLLRGESRQLRQRPTSLKVRARCWRQWARSRPTRRGRDGIISMLARSRPSEVKAMSLACGHKVKTHPPGARNIAQTKDQRVNFA